VAETTNGLAHQSGGSSRDPFAPLPGTKSATATTSPSTSQASSASTHSSSASTGAGSGGGSSSHGTGATNPATTPNSSKPKPPAPAYHVAALFGVVPAGTPVQNVQLTPYENLAPGTPLPSSKQPLVVFKGVTANGKSATFAIAGEVILHGSAACIPSASQCLAIELAPGLDEELEYYAPSGQATVYQLEVVSIATSKASTARAHASRRRAHIGRRHAHPARRRSHASE